MRDSGFNKRLACFVLHVFVCCGYNGFRLQTFCPETEVGISCVYICEKNYTCTIPHQTCIIQYNLAYSRSPYSSPDSGLLVQAGTSQKVYHVIDMSWNRAKTNQSFRMSET